MGGEKRRENLLKILQESESAVSGTKLATKFQVSRQVIVQDIALLRAKNHIPAQGHNRERLCTSGQRKHSESF